VANQRKRKKRIGGLEGPDGWIEDNKGMLEHAVEFYKELFGKEASSGVRLGQDFWAADEIVRETVFGSYAEGSPGPDGFSFLFYQAFWDLIKEI